MRWMLEHNWTQKQRRSPTPVPVRIGSSYLVPVFPRFHRWEVAPSSYSPLCFLLIGFACSCSPFFRFCFASPCAPCCCDTTHPCSPPLPRVLCPLLYACLFRFPHSITITERGKPLKQSPSVARHDEGCFCVKLHLDHYCIEEMRFRANPLHPFILLALLPL
jgi:hypothetical protein